MGVLSDSRPGVAVGVVALVDEGLGNTAYLLDLGDGRALAVDAGRDLRALRRVARSRGLTIAYAADTHLHADFLTGAPELAATEGAQLLASAAGQRRYAHTGLRDGDEVDMGGLTLRALATPGHTFEHLAYAVLDGPRVVGVFTGGSLIVGAAARTDLVAQERTEELARAQYRSLRRLARLDDTVAVWPTHGAGSLCSAAAGVARTSTIGAEKAANPLLRAKSEDSFVAALLACLEPCPTYFARMPALNRLGPTLVGESATLAGVGVGDLARLLAGSAEVVDVRPVLDFAAGHVPGAVSIALRPAFATWLGWLLDPDRPLVVVLGPDEDPDEVVWQARKVGYDGLVGELAGGTAAWAASGRPLASVPVVRGDALSDPAVRGDALPDSAVAGSSPAPAILDVRQDGEFAAGHVSGAVHVRLGDLPNRLDAVPSGPTVIMCAHGERAMSAASLLTRSGRTDLVALIGGPEDWSQATGMPLLPGS